MSSGARDYQPGQDIPGTVYRVVRRIGSGGMGTVYDVEDTSIGKRYVLKALHPQLGDREDLARRMQIEARALARLHHPNIVDIITAGVTGDDLRLPYYVMEKLNGQSLRVILEKKGPIDLPHALHIAIDLLDALDHAHDKGVIHRDVKPDNILLHRTSAEVTVTKLLDFGIVSLLDAKARETAGRFLGTLRYAAPEQLRGDKPTAKMDVYCAGLVLYEMIAGRGPFDDEGDSMQIAQAHLHKTPPLVSRFAFVPSEVDRLLAAALAKPPDARPRDAFSFAALLRNLKKAIAASATREPADDRKTSRAMLEPSPPAAPIDDAGLSPHGPDVGSAGLPLELASPGTPAPQPSTMPGATPSTAAEPSAQTATAMAQVEVDREAATRTLPGQAGTKTAGGNTEGLGVGPGIASTLPSEPASVPAVGSDGILPLNWPPERPAARSEEPQVRSLPGASDARTTSRAAIVMGISATAGLAFVAGGLLFLRAQGAPRAASAPAPAVPVASVIAPPPAPEPVITMPAPTLPPPALDDTPERAPPAASSVVAGSAAVRPPAARPRVVPSAKPVTTATSTSSPDRPGPGF